MSKTDLFDRKKDSNNKSHRLTDDHKTTLCGLRLFRLASEWDYEDDYGVTCRKCIRIIFKR